MTPSPASHHTIWALTDSISLQARRVITVLFGLLLALGIYNGYRVCAYGLGFADEPFHIINAMDPLNSPLTVLNGIIGGAFGNTFGWGLLGFRYFAWTLNLVAFLACGVFFFWKTRDALVALGVLSLIVLYESTSRFMLTLYGWDCMVIPLIAIIACLSLYYSENRRMWILICISILCGLATLVKVTNIALLGLLPLFFFIKNRRIGDSAILILLSIAVFLTGLWLCFGSSDNYLNYLNLNQNKEHGTVYTLIELLIASICYVVPFAVFYFAQIGIIKRFSYFRFKLLSLFILAMIMANLVFMKIECHYWRIHFLYFGVGLAFATVANVVKRNWCTGLFVFAISCMTAVGSTDATMKYFVALSILLSLAYLVNRENLKVVAVACVIFGSAFICFRSHHAGFFTFQDSGMPRLTESVRHDKLRGILTTKEKKVRIEEAVALVDNQRTCVVGDSTTRYVYEYMFGSINPYLRQGFGKKDNFAKQWYVDSICGNISRADKGMQYLYLSTDTTTAMYTALDSLLTEKARGDYAIIFVKD